MLVILLRASRVSLGVDISLCVSLGVDIVMYKMCDLMKHLYAEVFRLQRFVGTTLHHPLSNRSSDYWQAASRLCAPALTVRIRELELETSINLKDTAA